MALDYFRYLIIRTNKEGRASVVASSDSYESIIKTYSELKAAFSYELEAGFFRFDLYSVDKQRL